MLVFKKTKNKDINCNHFDSILMILHSVVMQEKEIKL